ncbi:unnamed protein product, partial [Prorocentrum cordatum]
AVTRLLNIAHQLAPRSLMDGLTTQWIGQVGDGGASMLRRAVRELTEQMRPLGMQINKLAKSGWLATSQDAKMEFRPAARAPALPERQGPRSFGHDTHGTAARRHRAMLLCCCAASITAYLATQRGPFLDPVHEATAAPLVAHAAQIRDGHPPLAKPQQARGALEQRRSETAPFWQTGRPIELLRQHPQEMRKLAREGVAWWHGRQIPSHHQSNTSLMGARLWRRAARHVPAPPRAKIRGARAGHPRKLWAGGAWDAVRRHAARYISSPDCP